MFMLRTAAFVAILGALSFLTSCTTTSVVRQDTSRSFDTVVVDAGHGGKDAGAVRRHAPAEKRIALDVAQRVNQKLRAANFKTVMTRSSDVFVPLDRRVAIGNAQPNSIFVSIHFNDSRRRAIRGVETYYASPYARELARRIQGKLTSLPGTRGRGVMTANFRVVRNAVYPSVLVECGYLSNRSEARRVSGTGYREMVAEKIAEAIIEQRGRPAPGPAYAAAGTSDRRGALSE